MTKFAITYWQSYQYSLTVDAAEVIPAVREWAEKAHDPDGAIARTLAELEAGRIPADLFIVAEALEEDGQMVADDGAAPDSSDEPGDYSVELVQGMSAGVKWREDPDGVGPGGDVGGDYQAGEAWSFRLTSEQAPLSLITVYVFAEALRVNHGDGDEPSGEYGVTVMTEFLTCTDMSDPGGTETWSDCDYDYEADPIAYDSAEEADRAAKALAEIWAVHRDRFEWDGEPSCR
jgi:hypothetical protein